MDLKGAKIRNFYQIGAQIENSDECPKTFSIPHYQRPFSWDDTKVKCLVEDYFGNTSEENPKYFTGAIVTVVKDDSHDIVDGQQRFTTIFLANILKFLIMRLYFKEAIRAKNPYTSHNTEGFVQCCRFLFEKSIIDESSLNDLLKTGTSVEDSDEQKRVLSEYCQIVGLPDILYDAKDYDDQYRLKTRALFKKNSIRLRYARESYNDQLVSSISDIVLRLSSELNLTIEIIDAKKRQKDNNVKNYLNATLALFEAFEKKSDKKSKDVLENTDLFLKNVNTFLKGINVCVVQTGNERDAYTLFEVLNDRGMELDDLDLIKNYFFRHYVKLNEDLDYKEVDNTIEELENIWSLQTFKKNDTDFLKRLVIYCGVVYLTGVATIKNEKGDKFRKHVIKYLSDKTDYSKEDVISDFNVFFRIKVLFETVDLAYAGKDRDASVIRCAIVDDDVAYIKKVISLIFALKYDGVMPAIINMYLSLKLDVTSIKPAIVEMMKESVAKEKYTDFEKNAYALFNLILCSKDHSRPKQKAESVVRCLNSFALEAKISDCSDYFKISEDIKKEFNIYMNDWRYKHDLKVRLLFLLLNCFTKNDDKLVRSFNKNKITMNMKLNLDHLEPEQPDEVNMSAYLDVNDRDSIVNSLGNMMIMDQSGNASKGNKPFKFCFEYMKKAGFANTFLYENINDLFEENNDHKVPTAIFFEKRSRKLRELFCKILELPYDENKIKI